MTAFYFIRHGQMDFSLENTKFFQGRGTHMIPLSELGRQQIKTAAQDERLRDAQLIISSPFGRTLHSAAILSKELGLDIRVDLTSTSGRRTPLTTPICPRRRPAGAGTRSTITTGVIPPVKCPPGNLRSR